MLSQEQPVCIKSAGIQGCMLVSSGKKANVVRKVMFYVSLSVGGMWQENDTFV